MTTRSFGRDYRFKCRCGNLCDGTLTHQNQYVCGICFDEVTRPIVEEQEQKFRSGAYLHKGVGERIKIEQFDL